MTDFEKFQAGGSDYPKGKTFSDPSQNNAEYPDEKYPELGPYADPQLDLKGCAPGRIFRFEQSHFDATQGGHNG